MSWSASYVVEKQRIVGALELSNVLEVPEHHEQYNQACAAAYSMILSGVFGDVNERYQVRSSGHGNPGHKPRSGWANDFVSITITQLGEEK